MRFYRRLDTVRAISFDLDDTLYDNYAVIRKTEQAMLDWLHANVAATRTLTAAHWYKLKQQVATSQPGLSDNVSQWRLETLVVLMQQLGMPLANAKRVAAQAMAIVVAARHEIDVPHETHNVLKALSAHFPLAAITNGNVDIHKIGLGDYFSFSLQGGVEGAAKPAKDLFEIAAARTHIPLKHWLHVGDDLITDVGGARQAGAMAVWINLHHHRLGRQPKCRLLPDWEITSLTPLLSLLPSDA
ncbi:5-amino-6-(5-phospho-D-ribitylamino)uracil phosphatase YigB [Thaumasiovibrio subtropicus]|uniref:5-amino-6-(5-phospho-D-ribitylamino)uracil phosphatase YigB n=1 Tax=Thaumasiovibrio subtropicus TaxID=1891207 RepID=UPI000B35D49B|nr:5-amino-6-(5-phospho-D-ribitylamino)uracil phosphatase YigB [Thaumasiovibrio subtropicus]